MAGSVRSHWETSKLPFGVSLQSAFVVSLHGGPAVVDVHINVAERLPAVARQSVGHVHEQLLTGATRQNQRGDTNTIHRMSHQQWHRQAHLMQFTGSCSQSMSQRNRSHASQPIGGVLISPLSRPSAAPHSRDASRGANISAGRRRRSCT